MLRPRPSSTEAVAVRRATRETLLLKGVVLGGAVAVAGVSSWYMHALRAPAVIATRPELTEIGFWTALFSGRFSSWIYWHHPLAGAGITFAVILAVALGAIYDV